VFVDSALYFLGALLCLGEPLLVFLAALVDLDKVILCRLSCLSL